MKILVLNAGSSSLKYQLFDMENESVIAKGLAERISMTGSTLKQEASGKEYKISRPMPTHTEAMEFVLAALLNKESGAISDVGEIGAVGHRILHSGEDFDSSVLVTEETLAKCYKNVALGPLHMPGNLACVDSCIKVMKGVPMVMVFDTTFHATMPQKAFMYAIPYEVYEKYKVRKYGFHGTSHKFVSAEAAKIVGKNSKIIVCHLGNGSSITAVKDGKCVDTSMGFTPLEGLVMGTRSGDIDPAAIDYIAEKLGKTLPDMVQYLNKQCGMLGVSGFSSDCRDLTERAEAGDKRAELALEMNAYRVKKYVGAYAAVLGGADAIVFTGGIGEHSQLIRRLVMEGMEYLGIDFDFERNENPGKGIAELTRPSSRARVFIIPTNEELSIARETAAVIAAQARN
ncbi:MAG: acetate/propionate family kinase [Christensenellales bacterium]|jgi:acetate kinase